MICTEADSYVFRGRLYQVEKILPDNFVVVSRSSIVNYHLIDHLEIIRIGNIDAIMKNGLRIQVARRKIKYLKERIGL